MTIVTGAITAEPGFNETFNTTSATTLGPKLLGLYWYYWVIIAFIACAVIVYVFMHFRSQKTPKSKAGKETINRKVLEQIRAGRTLVEIRKLLIDAGHDRGMVNDVVGTMEIYNFILTHLKKGHSPTVIQNHLVRHGWDHEKISKLMHRASERVKVSKKTL
ncbi:MAG: hypothetical protein ABIG20_00160 [archaeon]